SKGKFARVPVCVTCVTYYSKRHKNKCLCHKGCVACVASRPRVRGFWTAYRVPEGWLNYYFPRVRDLVWKRHKRHGGRNAHEIRTTRVPLAKTEATSDTAPSILAVVILVAFTLPVFGVGLPPDGRGEAFEPFFPARFQRRKLPAALAQHALADASALYQV